MGRRSRNKGKRGEREWAHYLAERGVKNAKRTGWMQSRGSAEQPDVTHPFFAAEVKRHKSFVPKRLLAALDQARSAAKDDEVPYVAARNDGGEWVVAMGAEDFAELARVYSIINFMRLHLEGHGYALWMVDNNAAGVRQGKEFIRVSDGEFLIYFTKFGDRTYVTAIYSPWDLRVSKLIDIPFSQVLEELETARDMMQTKAESVKEVSEMGVSIWVGGWLFNGVDGKTYRYNGVPFEAVWDEDEDTGMFVASTEIEKERYTCTVSTDDSSPIDAVRCLIRKIVRKNPQWAEEATVYGGKHD